jgi:hypothetical protein
MFGRQDFPREGGTENGEASKSSHGSAPTVIEMMPSTSSCASYEDWIEAAILQRLGCDR